MSERSDEIRLPSPPPESLLSRGVRIQKQAADRRSPAVAVVRPPGEGQRMSERSDEIRLPSPPPKSLLTKEVSGYKNRVSR